MHGGRTRKCDSPFEGAGCVGIQALLIEGRAQVGVRGRVLFQSQGAFEHLRRPVEPLLLKERRAQIVVRTRIVRGESLHALELGHRLIQPVEVEIQRTQAVADGPVIWSERHRRG